MGWYEDLSRSGWAGSGPQATQEANDRVAKGASGTQDVSKSTAQNTYKDKTQDPDAQSDAMKRRMQQAGGN